MNIGFVSTRFAGTDGVSLEATKWAEIFERFQHEVYWFSGLSDRPKTRSMVVPTAHFAHPEILAISEAVWGQRAIPRWANEAIAHHRSELREALADFVTRFSIEVLIVENALAIPMHLPLGLALTDLIRDTRIPTIGHHHDFYWERERFWGEATQAILAEAFPPCLANMAHAVIHSGAEREMQERFGIQAIRVPNVMDFAMAPPPTSRTREEIRSSLGYDEEVKLILQPTRVVPRKGIELAIALVAALEDPSVHLLVSHEAGDEGYHYQDQLRALAKAQGVSLRFLDPENSGETLTLPELYEIADLVSYPSLYEGFGNALIEALWFRKPVVVNRYTVFREDIEPLGFEFVVMDGIVSDEIVAEVRSILDDPERIAESVERNYQLAAQNFSYEVLQGALRKLLAELGKTL